MAEITYVFGEIRTGTIVEEIALEGVSGVTSKLNDWGSLRGTFTLDQSGKSNADLVAAVTPGKNFVVVERDSLPIWGGIVWGYTYQSQSKTMQITARTMEAYLERVRIEYDTGWIDYERRNVLIDLINIMQSNPYRDLGIDVPSYLPDASLVTVNVAAIDRARLFTLISSIADGAEGFDWRIVWSKSPSGRYLKTLQIGSPTIGNTDPTLLTFDYPGAITNYYETSSITNSGTNIATVGSGSGADTLSSNYEHTDLLSEGRWPRYDLDVQRKDISDQLRLDSIGMQEGLKRRPPMVVTKVFLKGDQDPQFGTYNLGDACRVSIVDPKHPNGVDSNARIVAMSYTPQSDDSVEEAELIFEGDELNE